MAIWGLDRPLTYRVPEAMAGAVRLGSIVRVPLRGRRVRGWVLSVTTATAVPDGVVPLAGVSGTAPVFDEALLEVARRLARVYVHPLAAFLHLLTPPQMGRAMRRQAPAAAPALPAAPPPATLGLRILRRLGPREDPVTLYAADVAATLAAGRGAIVVVPEVREGSQVMERLVAAFPDDAAVVHSGQSPAERSKALWSVARGSARVVLGGRAAVLVPAFDLGLVIVHDEADRTLKEQRSPYYDAREVAEQRAAASGATLLLASQGPSLRSYQRAVGGAGWRFVEPPRDAIRAVWPVVELVDPSRAIMPRRAVAAVLSAAHAGTRVLVLVPRLQATPAGPGPAEVAAYLRKVAPALVVTRADPGGLASPADLERALTGDIVVATEGALADVERPAVGTAVALGVDAMIHRPSGRAAEGVFATLWELACLLGRNGSPAAGAASSANPGANRGANRGKGRLLLETDTPGHHAVQAVVRGDYTFFARHELAARAEAGSPPFTGLIRVRASGGEMSPEVVERLAGLPGTELLGPVPGRLGAEVLLKVGSTPAVLDPLRALVASAGERLLVEMEPREW